MKDKKMLSIKNKKAFINNLSFKRLNKSILNEDNVVKLPKRPMYKNM